MKDTEVRD